MSSEATNYSRRLHLRRVTDMMDCILLRRSEDAFLNCLASLNVRKGMAGARPQP